jgi:hypothetical protein
MDFIISILNQSGRSGKLNKKFNHYPYDYPNTLMAKALLSFSNPRLKKSGQYFAPLFRVGSNELRILALAINQVIMRIVIKNCYLIKVKFPFLKMLFPFRSFAVM